MIGGWGSTFIVSALLAMLATPLLRRLALATGFVDHPAERKSHTRAVPYLGGVGVMAATVIGTMAGPSQGVRWGLVLGAAAALGLMGLVDDRRGLGPAARLIPQLAAAGLAYAGGVRAVATDIALLDAVITIVWIVGMTNAFNLLDNMDGLSSGAAGAASFGLFALAVYSNQRSVATVAIALAGACVGFLAHNSRPAAIFMGDAGSLFLGFLLSVLALEVDPRLGPPASFGVPFLLLALPVLDTATVTLARLRHRRSVASGGKDHLSHRLVARGLAPGLAVATLVGVEAVLAALAMLAGRNVLPLDLALVTGVVVLAALAVVAGRTTVYAEPVVGLPAKLRLAMGAAVVGAALVSAPAAVAVIRSRQPIVGGARAAQEALAAARVGDSIRAAEASSRAGGAFAEGRRRLHAPLSFLGLGVPVLSSNLRAGRTLTEAGVEVADAASRLARADGDRLQVRAGGLDLAEVRRLTPELARVATTLEDANRAIGGIDNPYLLPLVRNSVRELDLRLDRASVEVRQAAEISRWLPELLGGNGPRRYFLAVQDNAEARATGGFIGHYGELVASGGTVRLERFGPIGELRGGRDLSTAPEDFVRRYARFDVPGTWQNINLSPDLPTVARVIADLYPDSGGRPVDGVVAVDAEGLAALLQLTGPLAVAPWAEPIGLSNVVEATLNQAYVRLPEPDRSEFFGKVADSVVRKVTSSDLGTPIHLAQALGPAMRGGHLAFTFVRPGEDALAHRAGVAGAVPKAPADSMMIVTQNAAGNKIDYYLRRRVRYRLRLEPDDDSGVARVTGELTVVLDNQAPSVGLPRSVIGPYDPARFAAGENRTFLSLYTPHAFRQSSVDGKPVTLESGTELGRRVYSSYISVPSKTAKEVNVELAGEVKLEQDGSYRLDLVQQPLIHPDEVEVSVEVPKGWRLAGVDGLQVHGDRSCSGSFKLESDRVLRVELERTGGLWLLDKILGRR